MPNYLIYHPTRTATTIGRQIIYHDGFGGGNSDPYVWNERFLHSFCHMSQIRLSAVKTGDINFWVSASNLRQFTELHCDLVFVVGDKVPWRDRYDVSPTDPFVDSRRAYDEHYLPGCKDHRNMGNRRHRYTLKADPARSFQPQDAQHNLLDVVPALQNLGLSLDDLRRGLDNKWHAKPMIIDDQVASGLYDYLLKAPHRLSGKKISGLYPEGSAIGKNDPTHCGSGQATDVVNGPLCRKSSSASRC